MTLLFKNFLYFFESESEVRFESFFKIRYPETFSKYSLENVYFEDFKRVEHFAIAVKNMDIMRDIFENKLGIQMEYEEELPHYSTKLAMYPIGETYLEVLESSSPKTETSKWIEEHGEGLFHICLEVEDIDGALVELREKGVKLLDETPRIGHGGARIAFLNPESTGNLLIELAELSAAEGH